MWNSCPFILIQAWAWIAMVPTLLLFPSQSDAFAYAPNFITKIVQEQTGIKPTGLLEIDSKDDSGEDEASSSTNKIDRPVTTRFPPEPNGYLHLGHAKAVCFNFAVSRMFGGNCNMRMDDTNPTKEDEEYVESILQDVKWIQSGLFEENNKNNNNDSGQQEQEQKPWEGEVRKTSSYFDTIYEAAEALIKSGDAYVDSLSAEEMREYRGSLTEPGKDSPFRTRSVEENLELFRKVRTIIAFNQDGIK